MIGARPELKWLPVTRLQVDMRYQRSITSRRSQKVIEKIAREFRWPLFQAALVAPAPLKGHYNIIDGQHRVQACRLRGDISEVPCIVIAAETAAEAAMLFVKVNQDRTNVGLLQVHKAQLAAGDPEAVEIDRVCRLAGVRMRNTPVQRSVMKHGDTIAIGAVRSCIKDHGSDITARGLGLLKSAYDIPGYINAGPLKAVCALIGGVIGNPPPDMAILDVLRRFTPLDLRLEAERLREESVATGAEAFAVVVMQRIDPVVVDSYVETKRPVSEGMALEADLRFLTSQGYDVGPGERSGYYRFGAMDGNLPRHVQELAAHVRNRVRNERGAA